jgi:hypothetical protein
MSKGKSTTIRLYVLCAAEDTSFKCLIEKFTRMFARRLVFIGDIL